MLNVKMSEYLFTEYIFGDIVKTKYVNSITDLRIFFHEKLLSSSFQTLLRSLLKLTIVLDASPKKYWSSKNREYVNSKAGVLVFDDVFGVHIETSYFCLILGILALLSSRGSRRDMGEINVSFS